jgi:hypothetical protein
VYELYGPMVFLGSSQDMLLIVQDGHTFSAVMQVGTKFHLRVQNRSKENWTRMDSKWFNQID